MAITETDRFPGLSPSLQQHPLMKSRKTGACSVMKGSILLTFLFADIPGHPWTAADKKSALEVLMESLKPLLRDARSRNIPLKIQTQHLACRVDTGVTMSDHDPWVEKALKSAGLPPLKDVHTHLARKAGTDGAVICFCVNSLGRSFAVSGANEYIILFEPESLFHEFCHVYGASDFYYPEKLAELAKKFYPNSIMLSSSTETPGVDGITAYLIGWTDTLSRREQDFLKELEKIPLSHFTEGREKEYTTGDVTNFRTRNGVYTGHMVDGNPQGRGRYVYDSGIICEGEFESGYLHGQGERTDAAKNRSIGTFVKGKLEGEGTILYANGNRFQGMFSKGAREGFGTMMWASGDRYSGNYVQDKRSGYGTYSFPDGSRYEGEFLDGKYHGQGENYYASGAVYRGGYDQDQMSGQGVITWPNGASYRGQFLQGKFHGKGEYRYADGGRYVGQYREDLRHGYGELYYADGGMYKGYFEKDQRSGKGIKLWPDGTRYEGDFRNDVKWGKGTMTWPNGSSYTGEFVNDLRTGQGTYRFPDKSTYTGQFREGRKHGHGTYTFPDGSKKTGRWDNDKFIG